MDSVVNQNCMPFEIILVNDGSNDATPGMLHEWKHRHGDIVKVLELDGNYGPSRARNLAWESASGDFIAFLDSDDSWHPCKIEIQLDWMIRHPEATLTGHRCVQIQEKTVEYTPTRTFDAYPIKPAKLLLSNILLTRSVMVKRDLPFRFQENKRHSEDYLLWLETVLSGFNAWYLDLPLSYSYKAAYGAQGLSSSLWHMEKGELDTYRTLYQKGLISLPVYIPLIHFSMLKHMIRLIKHHRHNHG